MSQADVATAAQADSSYSSITIERAATTRIDDVVASLNTSPAGMSQKEAARRLAAVGPNAVPRVPVRLLSVLAAQARNPLLGLLFATSVLSAVVGERANAAIILTILSASTGLGAVNDYRAARVARSLQSVERRRAVALRDRTWATVDAADLVPGDVVRISAGMVVPADLRLLTANGLSCDESALNGEAMPVEKESTAVTTSATLADLSDCAFSGTIVRSGDGVGVVVATGGRAQLGRIEHGLEQRAPTTAFEAGLRQFSGLLAAIAVVVSGAVFVVNVLLGRGVLDALLFASAIAVGITPQLLPAVVSSSLAHGARTLAARKVLVKRLVAIEDLGNIDVLITDKTGTLTTGEFRLAESVDTHGTSNAHVAELGLMASDIEPGRAGEPPAGDSIDVALWNGVPDAFGVLTSVERLTRLPFDHERRRSTVVVSASTGPRFTVTKGAPESVLAICTGVSAQERELVDARLAAGGRVLAVATGTDPTGKSDNALETGLRLRGLLVFDDPARADVSPALEQLARLDVRVIIATGDSVGAAARLAPTVGIGTAGATLTGDGLDGLSDNELAGKAFAGQVVARVSPQQKARLVRCLRSAGHAVAFLGDGVNDALALHTADVGISVDTAADVAREAADVVLLEKSLDVVADGVAQGRRIFANTIKYVLMGTSSNFGNILSASAASALLDFLPMWPSQLLLNNLLYDSGQLAIPTDRVDDDQLRRPGAWDIGVIRRFMLTFGPLSSLFDFMTFGILLGPLHADATRFRTGWFVESLATQALVVFVIRTRCVPFLRSRPSRPLVASTAAVVLIGAALPLSPLRGELGFARPEIALYLSVAALAAAYLVLVDMTKRAVFSGVYHRSIQGGTAR